MAIKGLGSPLIVKSNLYQHTMCMQLIRQGTCKHGIAKYDIKIISIERHTRDVFLAVLYGEIDCDISEQPSLPSASGISSRSVCVRTYVAVTLRNTNLRLRSGIGRH